MGVPASPVMTVLRPDPEIDPAVPCAQPSWPALTRSSTLSSSINARRLVYIKTNRPNGVLCIGVTSDTARRAYEHREGLVPGLKRLVYIVSHERIADAIQR
jgi:hypothetical protein